MKTRLAVLSAVLLLVVWMVSVVALRAVEKARQIIPAGDRQTYDGEFIVTMGLGFIATYFAGTLILDARRAAATRGATRRCKIPVNPDRAARGPLAAGWLGLNPVEARAHAFLPWRCSSAPGALVVPAGNGRHHGTPAGATPRDPVGVPTAAVARSGDFPRDGWHSTATRQLSASAHPGRDFPPAGVGVTPSVPSAASPGVAGNDVRALNPTPMREERVC